jgi:hypothetical protein
MDKQAQPAKTVNELIELCAANDSAACNVLDMIDAGEVSPADTARLAALYEASKS